MRTIVGIAAGAIMLVTACRTVSRPPDDAIISGQRAAAVVEVSVERIDEIVAGATDRLRDSNARLGDLADGAADIERTVAELADLVGQYQRAVEDLIRAVEALRSPPENEGTDHTGAGDDSGSPNIGNDSGISAIR